FSHGFVAKFIFHLLVFSFEDSSSISSGISENFEDLSTDDLTGSSVCEFPMAAAAARSTSEYHNLGFRTSSSKLPNPLPSSQRQSRSNGVFQNIPPVSSLQHSCQDHFVKISIFYLH